MNLSSQNFQSPAALLRFFGVAAAGLAIDLWTKSLTLQYLSTGRIVRFIPGYLQFEYVENHGAVFGIGQGDRWIFIGVSVLAVAFLVFLFGGSGRQRFYQVLLGMLLAGVLGNLYDRIVYGHVRDMIHILPAWPRLYPWVFNVADSLLCVGVALMLVYSFIQGEHQIHGDKSRPADDAPSH
jgi:signal peptidase II